MVVEMYRDVKNWSVQVESYDCGCKKAQILRNVPDSLNLGWREELSKSAQYLLWRSPRRALDQDPGFWADSASGEPRDNTRSIGSNLHTQKGRATASIRLSRPPPRAVDAPEAQVVVVRPPRSRRVEDRVGGVDAGHAVHAAGVPVGVVLQSQPSVRRADFRLGCCWCYVECCVV